MQIILYIQFILGVVKWHRYKSFVLKVVVLILTMIYLFYSTVLSIENLDNEDSSITVFLAGKEGIVFSSLAGLIGCIVGAILSLLLIVSVCVLAVLIRKRRIIRLSRNEPQLSTHNLSGSPQSSGSSSHQSSLTRGSEKAIGKTGSPLQIGESSMRYHESSANISTPHGSVALLSASQTSVNVSPQTNDGYSTTLVYSGSSFPLLMTSEASIKSYDHSSPTAMNNCKSNGKNSRYALNNLQQIRY